MVGKSNIEVLAASSVRLTYLAGRSAGRGTVQSNEMGRTAPRSRLDSA